MSFSPHDAHEFADLLDAVMGAVERGDEMMPVKHGDRTEALMSVKVFGRFLALSFRQFANDIAPLTMAGQTEPH